MAKRTKTDKLLNVMATGKEFTPAQLAKKTGLANVGSTVNRLREQGVTIYTNPKRNKKTGSVQNFYRMGA